MTVTVSRIGAGDSSIWTSSDADTGCSFTANPPARTMSVAVPSGNLSKAKRPSGPVTARSSPESPRRTTEAPGIAPPAVSLTMPVTAAFCASNKENIRANNMHRSE